MLAHKKNVPGHIKAILDNIQGDRANESDIATIKGDIFHNKTLELPDFIDYLLEIQFEFNRNDISASLLQLFFETDVHAEALVSKSLEFVDKDKLACQQQGLINYLNLPMTPPYYFVVRKFLTKATKKNHVEAWFKLGNMNEEGLGLANEQPDVLTTYYCYNQAAKRNHAQAMVSLGNLHMEGWGLPKNTPDYARATTYYENATQQNDTQACAEAWFKLGMMKEQGCNSAKNKSGYQLAYDYYTKAARFNHAQAWCKLGLMNKKRVAANDNKVNPEQVYGCFKKAAQLGDAQAWFQLGLLYKNGWHLTDNQPNYQVAGQCYAQAAKQNHTEAWYALGLMYLKGLVLTNNQPNYQTASTCFNKAKNSLPDNHPRQQVILSETEKGLKICAKHLEQTKRDDGQPAPTSDDVEFIGEAYHPGMAGLLALTLPPAIKQEPAEEVSTPAHLAAELGLHPANAYNKREQSPAAREHVSDPHNNTKQLKSSRIL